MHIKDSLLKNWISCSFTVFAALFLTVGAYAPATAFGEEGEIVEVDTVEELYAEFYSKPGATIQLAPGIYSLSSHDSNGVPRPKEGRLVVRPDETAIAIKGHNTYADLNVDGVWDPRDDNEDGLPDLDLNGEEIYADPLTETVIDGAALGLSGGPSSIIRVSEDIGSTSITSVSMSVSKVTMRNSGTSTAAIQLRTFLNTVSSLKVTDCIIENGQRGLQVSENDDTSNFWEANLIAERNIIRGHTLFGIQSVRFFAISPTFSAHLKHNRSSNNRFNLGLGYGGGEDGKATVLSQSNIYEEAFGAGIRIFIRDFENSTSHNEIKLISEEDSIYNNEGLGGVYVEGILRDSDQPIMDNLIHLEFFETHFVKVNDDGTHNGEQNRNASTRRDITIVGANNGGFTGPASDNKVKVKVKEATISLMPTDYDSDPQPVVAIDNAPDQVEVELELEEINYIGL